MTLLMVIGAGENDSRQQDKSLVDVRRTAVPPARIAPPSAGLTGSPIIAPEMVDYYTILEVDRSSSAAEIKKA